MKKIIFTIPAQGPKFLSRHLRGDWGDTCPEDKAENELTLKHGLRLMSSCRVTENENLWMITEADRTLSAKETGQSL